MAGKFECYKDKAGEFRFRLVAANGNAILSSEGYKSKSGCANGIESVRKNSQDPDRFVKTETAGGKFRFKLTAKNSQTIGISQNYASASGRNNGIKSVANNAPDATVVEES
ncbi:MAG: YegP family protein [Lysobacterales bacterium]